MRRRKEDEGQDEVMEVEQPDIEEAGAEETGAAQEETKEITTAQVDIVTSQKKATVKAPVKEYEEFKDSFKSMMASLVSLMEASGMEVGADETVTAISMLKVELDQMKKNLQAEQEKIRDGLVPRSEFDEFKSSTTAEEARLREGYAPRDEFEALKAATEERAAKASEDYVTRGEFERFRAAVREVI